jgi:hypothetical protein
MRDRIEGRVEVKVKIWVEFRPEVLVRPGSLLEADVVARFADRTSARVVQFEAGDFPEVRVGRKHGASTFERQRGHNQVAQG